HGSIGVQEWVWVIRKSNDDLLLACAIQTQQLLDDILVQSLMEHAGASTQGSSFCHLESETHAWIEIVAIANIGLSLVTHAERKIEFLRWPPVVLQKRPEFQLVHVEPWVALIPCERNGSAGGVIGQAGERESPDEVIFRERVVRAVQPLRAGLHRPFAAGIHHEVSKFNIPILTRTFILPASGEERIQNVNGDAGGFRY